MRVVNLPILGLPHPKSDIGIEGKYIDGVYRISTSEGWRICEIDNTENKQIIAERIAELIEIVRDRGFEQGRAYVREALGIKG